jgi:hypothetical protein
VGRSKSRAKHNLINRNLLTTKQELKLFQEASPEDTIGTVDSASHVVPALEDNEEERERSQIHIG